MLSFVKRLSRLRCCGRMSVVPLVVEVVVTFVVAVVVLCRYGDWYRDHLVVTVSVLIAWYFSMLIVFILPLDVSNVSMTGRLGAAAVLLTLPPPLLVQYHYHYYHYHYYYYHYYYHPGLGPSTNPRPSTWIFVKYKYSHFTMYLSTSTSTCHCT